MKERRYEIALRRDTHRFLSIDTAASCAGIHPSIVERFVECALIEPIRSSESIGELLFDAAVVPRLKRIERLRHDLGINLAGVSVILDMLDRIEAVQRENQNLRVAGEKSGVED